MYKKDRKLSRMNRFIFSYLNYQQVNILSDFMLLRILSYSILQCKEKAPVTFHILYRIAADPLYFSVAVSIKA